MTFIIASDDYMGTGYNMEAVQFPSLLDFLTNHLELGVYGETVKEMIEGFNESNGDGQPYYQVWCVEEGKKVLG